MNNIEPIKKYPISILAPKGSGAVSIVQPLSNAKSGFYTMEIWKDIPEWIGYYQASSHGRIRGVDRKVKFLNSTQSHKRRVLCLHIGERGYYKCKLSRNCLGYTYSVHRLIALCFSGNPNNYNEVNHIDGNKLNNNACNLEWTTRKKNMMHAQKNGLLKFHKGENHHGSKFTNEQIKKMRKEHNPKITFAIYGKKYNTTPGTIWKIITNKSYINV